MKSKELIQSKIAALNKEIQEGYIHIMSKYPSFEIDYGKSDYSDAMAYYVEVYKASLCNNIPEIRHQAKMEQLNRKWQRVFIALIASNIIIWSQILTN